VHPSSSSKSWAETLRRIPRPDYLSSFFGAAAARQRLDPPDLFTRLLVEGGVAEVDVYTFASAVQLFRLDIISA
jgi:hypothetical protein